MRYPRQTACIATVIALASCTLSFIGCGDRARVAKTLVQDPPIHGRSNHAFTPDGFLTDNVVKLRRQEKLEEVVRGAGSELQFFERLTLWARQQFEPGVPDPYPLSNGLDILADIRSGKTGGFCGQYAYLLADALKSFGYFDVRYVELWADEQRSHFLVEAWSNSSARWVLLDPLHAALVVDVEGRPLSTWEVHAIATGRTAGTARRKWLAPADEVPRDADAAYLELYRLPAISLTNDLSRRVKPWSMQQRQTDFLALRDASNRELLPQQYAQGSEREADFHGARNVCRIRAEASTAGWAVELETLESSAYFAGFEIRVDDGPWRRAESRESLPTATSTLDCRTVNRLDVRGVTTRLEF